MQGFECFSFFFSFSQRFDQSLSAEWPLGDQTGQTGAVDCLRKFVPASHCYCRAWEKPLICQSRRAEEVSVFILVLLTRRNHLHLYLICCWYFSSSYSFVLRLSVQRSPKGHMPRRFSLQCSGQKFISDSLCGYWSNTGWCLVQSSTRSV